jgi:beta-lactamase superfamily II metal-dependent hydrolase
MILLFIYLFLLPKSELFSAEPNKMVSVVYNVGQGNCVAVNCPGDNSLLVDCGSSEHESTNRSDKPEINFANIKQEVNLLSSSKPITIIISHLDKDHYNWIPRIFDNSESVGRITKILIVGDEESLRGVSTKGSRGKLKEWITLVRRSGKDVIFFNNFNSPELQRHIPPCGTGRGDSQLPQILTVNACHKNKTHGSKHPECSSYDDTNANSLVLKLRYKTCSIILPGDAKGVTTDEIIDSSIEKIITTRTEKGRLLSEYKEYKDSPTKEDKFKFIPDQDEEYKATILLASHHGAHSERSNSTKWIYSVKPKVAIISAGKFGRYNHPSHLLLARFEDSEKSPYLLSSGEHPFSYFQGHIFKNKAIEKAVFNTFDAGDIRIVFSKKDEKGIFTILNARGQEIIEAECFDYSGSPQEKTKLERGEGRPTRPPLKTTNVRRRLRLF